jgi:hypothetical protein
VTLNVQVHSNVQVKNDEGHTPDYEMTLVNSPEPGKEEVKAKAVEAPNNGMAKYRHELVERLQAMRGDDRMSSRRKLNHLIHIDEDTPLDSISIDMPVE